MRIVVLCISALALAACSGERTPLRDLRSFDRSPEEFGVLPSQPLDVDGALALETLPEPTPGGANRTDLNPRDDAVVALGGNPARRAGSPDQSLIAAATRFGRDPDIRETLAREDEAYRDFNRLFTLSIIRQDNYSRIYEDQQLDPYAELRRFEARGVETPAAPPRE